MTIFRFLWKYVWAAALAYVMDAVLKQYRG
jgi:hypothetical protein